MFVWLWQRLTGPGVSNTAPLAVRTQTPEDSERTEGTVIVKKLPASDPVTRGPGFCHPPTWPQRTTAEVILNFEIDTDTDFSWACRGSATAGTRSRNASRDMVVLQLAGGATATLPTHDYRGPQGSPRKTMTLWFTS